MARGSQRNAAILVAVFLVPIAAALWLWHSSRLLPPPTAAGLRLTPVSFAALPGWKTGDSRPALAAFRRSCAVKTRSSPAQELGGAGYAGRIADWLAACAAAPAGTIPAAGARRYFETWFAPALVGAGLDSDALFTGYYEPEIRASTGHHGEYTTPIYGVPADLVTADLGLFRDSLKGVRVTGRVAGHAFLPYFTRAEIDARGLAGAPVLLYADDPVDVFFLQIQGSGRARLENGALVRLAYAGQNGRPYTPVGRVLIAQGAIERNRMSMQAIRGWMQAHPQTARAVMEVDQSFVFFRLTPLGDPALGSPGSEGVPLAPGASLAVDAHVHPLGAPFFVAATVPDSDPARPDRPLHRLFVAQDTGGAIRGAARADLFWGFGAGAEEVAGRLKSTGKLYVLLPRRLSAAMASYTEHRVP